MILDFATYQRLSAISGYIGISHKKICTRAVATEMLEIVGQVPKGGLPGASPKRISNRRPIYSGSFPSLKSNLYC